MNKDIYLKLKYLFSINIRHEMFKIKIFISKMSTYTVSISDNKGNIIWNQLVEDLDLLSGMLAAGIKIISILNKKHEYTIYSNIDVSSHRIESYFEKEDIITYTNDKLSEGEYGLWVASDVENQYHLYKFTLPVFFKGIIYMCESFKVDYKDYIFSTPFDYMDNKYEFTGYYMLDYNGYITNIPSVPESQEDEPDKDDENLLYPFNLD